MTGTHVQQQMRSPLIGRNDELAQLIRLWNGSKLGQRHVALLSGEAGIGKSRLVHTLKAHIAQTPHLLLEGRCSADYRQSAFAPLIDVFQRFLQLTATDTPSETFQKLEQRLKQDGLGQPDVVATMASFLSLPIASAVSLQDWSPQRLRKMLLSTAITWLTTLARQAPVLFIVEDLHWSDPSTLELLTELLDETELGSFLGVCTYRPEFRPPWNATLRVTQLELGRLSRSDVEQMVTSLADGTSLPRELVTPIAEKGDGNPLFVEELTRMVLHSELVRAQPERGERLGALTDLPIPVTLQELLLAKLDRLAGAKEGAQIAAVLGREFSHQVLQAVVAQDDALFQRQLFQLLENDILTANVFPGQMRYQFRHALIRDAAYASLPVPKRRQYHARVAELLERELTTNSGVQPELVARHYTEAGVPNKAVRYWYDAGQSALRRAAFTEGRSHIMQGLQALQLLPESSARDQLELGLQNTLGLILVGIKGYASPDVDHVYERGHQLAQDTGDSAQLMAVLRGEVLLHGVRAQYDLAREVGQRMLAIAEDTKEPAHRKEAFLSLGLIALYTGELSLSRSYFERSLAIAVPTPHVPDAMRFIADAHAMAYSYLARVLWLLGYPELAHQYSQEGVAIAESLGLPLMFTQAQAMHALMYHVRRDYALALTWAEKTIEYGEKYGFPYWLSLCTILKGWILDHSGQSPDGRAVFNRGLATHRATGARLGLSWMLAFSAEAAGRNGQCDEGLATLAEALAFIDETNERYYEAEVYRLKGTLTLQKFQVSGSKFPVPPNPQSRTFRTQAEAAAEACFLRARDIAQKQQAKSWELRATTSLARLWQQQGKSREAYDVLSAVYGVFTEGFATADLQDARALLEDVRQTMTK